MRAHHKYNLSPHGSAKGSTAQGKTAKRVTKQRQQEQQEQEQERSASNSNSSRSSSSSSSSSSSGNGNVNRNGNNKNKTNKQTNKQTSKQAKQSKAKQSKAKQSKAKQSKAKQSKAKQSKASKQRQRKEASSNKTMEHLGGVCPTSPARVFLIRPCNSIKLRALFTAPGALLQLLDKLRLLGPAASALPTPHPDVSEVARGAARGPRAFRLQRRDLLHPSLWAKTSEHFGPTCQNPQATLRGLKLDASEMRAEPT